MRETTKPSDLLEQLQDLVGCEYLSELKEVRYYSHIYRVLKYISPTAFSTETWMEAIGYLTGESAEGEDAVLRQQLFDHVFGDRAVSQSKVNLRTVLY